MSRVFARMSGGVQTLGITVDTIVNSGQGTELRPVVVVVQSKNFIQSYWTISSML